MFINNLNKRERYLAIATISVISAALFYVLLLMPVTTKWDNLNKQIKTKINVLEKDTAILRNQKQLESEYAKLSSLAKPAESGEKAIADALSFIENISRNNSCYIANIKPEGIKNAGAYNEILIDVSIEGNIGQLSKFLYEIENPRNNLMNIKSCTISAKSGQSGILKSALLISKALLY